MSEQLMVSPDQDQCWTGQVRKAEGQIPKDRLVPPTLDQPSVKDRGRE